MDNKPTRSFANRVMLGYVGAAVGLMLLIGIASTLFTFRLYAKTSNEVIAAATRTIERRVARYNEEHLSLSDMAPRLAADLERPRIRVAVYDANRRLLSESTSRLAPTGVVGAIASLMDLHTAQVPVGGGIVLISADLKQLEDTLHSYWTIMLPTGLVAVLLAWGVGRLITRQAVSPLAQISAAMQRFAHGDFRPEPIRSSGNDEIGELAHSYNGAINQVNSALAERDRTEAEIRQFIADAGHELRTPLTVIMGYLDVLEDGAVDAPAVRARVFSTLRQESRRMRSLIEKLIYLARLERGESSARELVDVSAVVERVVSSIAQRDAAAAVEVSTVPGARVVADATDISEAVRNLVDNALKYAPGAEVAVSTEVLGDDVVLVVRDDGPGMSAQDQAHAFDRFYRGNTNVEAEGSGLGLAIVKRAVQRSEGTIVLESREHEGTRFTIRLPRAPKDPAALLR
jgi:two-component system OmpR family sensor kinase